MISKYIFDISYAFRTNLFWLVFLFPGLMVSIKTRKYSDSSKTLTIIKSYAYTYILLAPVVLISYLLKWSLLPTFYFFVFLVVLSLIYFLHLGFTHVKQIREKIASSNKQINIFLLLIVLFLLFDYLLTTIVGNYLGGDARVHLAKILKTLNSGPSTVDPLLGANIEARYHYNIVHVIYALGSKLTYLAPFEFWWYSASFFRLLYWLASYALITFFFPKKPMRYFLLFFYIITIYQRYYFATYPNVTQVFLLFILSLIIITQFFENSSTSKFDVLEIWAVLFLIGFSHPLYILLSNGFFITLLLLFILFKTARLTKVISLTPGIALSFIFPVYSLFIPLYFRHDWPEIASTKFINFFRIKLAAVQFNNGQIDILLILAIIGLFLSTAIIQGNIKKISLITGFVFPIVILNTPVLAVLMRFLPFWAINRIVFMEVFSKILISLPLFWALEYFREKKLLEDINIHRFLSVIVLFIIILPFFGNISNYTKIRKINFDSYSSLKEIEGFKRYVKSGKLILADPVSGINIPSVLDIKILSLEEFSGHLNPATPDVDERLKALKAFFNGDIKRAEKYLTNPTYVMTEKNNVISRQSKKKLELVRVTSNYKLFKLLH